MANSYDATYLSEYWQDSSLRIGQGTHATSPGWQMASPFPTLVASSDVSSVCGISPRPEFVDLSPYWPSDKAFGLGQLQEATNTTLLDENPIPVMGYDTPRNPSQHIYLSQETLNQWNSLPQQQAPTYIISPPVLEPASIGSCESESKDWSTISSHDTQTMPRSSPMLSSSISELAECETTKLKEESPSSCHREGSRSSISSSWVAARRLSKKVSRTKSRSSSRRDSIQSDLDDGDYGSSSDHTRIGKSKNDRAFACPFYRMDPMRHMDCVNLKLSRIRDVKQHINRRHTQGPHYCPECWSTFSTVDPWEKHIKARSCEAAVSGDRTSILGVSEDMQKDLGKRVDKKLSSSEQWYTILKVLFKDTTKKPNPYVGTVVEETVGMMRDHWEQDGADIIHDVLERKNIPNQCAGHLSVLMKDLFDEVQKRFEQKTRRSGAIEADNSKQSVFVSGGSDTTMTDTQVRSPPPNDWDVVPEASDLQSEATLSLCPCGISRNQIGSDTDLSGVFQTRQPSGFAHSNILARFPSTLGNQASGWIAENSSQPQAMDKSVSQNDNPLRF